MNARARSAAAIAAALLGSTILRRSRLARLGALAAMAGAGYGKLGRRRPSWHDVPPPPP